MLIVNLTESRTIWETGLWASMDGNQSFNSLIGVWSPVHCAWHHSLAGARDCVHGERERQCASVTLRFVSACAMWAVISAPAPLTSLPWWTVTYNRELEQNLSLFCWGICHINKKGKQEKGLHRFLRVGSWEATYYSWRQLSIWLPEFKTILMDKSFFLT